MWEGQGVHAEAFEEAQHRRVRQQLMRTLEVINRGHYECDRCGYTEVVVGDVVARVSPETIPPGWKHVKAVAEVGDGEIEARRDVHICPACCVRWLNAWWADRFAPAPK